MKTTRSEIAVYIQGPTLKLSSEDQLASINEWLELEGIPSSDVKFYSEQKLANDSQDNLRQLINAIRLGKHSKVVIWDISQISQYGRLARNFSPRM